MSDSDNDDLQGPSLRASVTALRRDMEIHEMQIACLSHLLGHRMRCLVEAGLTRDEAVRVIVHRGLL